MKKSNKKQNHPKEIDDKKDAVVSLEQPVLQKTEEQNQTIGQKIDLYLKKRGYYQSSN